MDANGKEKIRMIMRLLETIHLEVSRMLPEKEDNLASSSAAPKETGVGQISKEARRAI